MAINKYKKGLSKKLTAHFNLKEFQCKGVGCCNETLLDLNLAKLCEKLRVFFGVSITITSGYRCPKHNSEVKGDVNSSHKSGTAADITNKNISSQQFAIAAELLGAKRIGIYSNSPNMVHIGTGSKLHWLDTGKYQPTSHSFIPVKYKKPPITAVVKNGAKAEYIAYVQACLFAKGYVGKDKKPITIDGKYGKNTIYAINQFRKAHGWKPNGVLKINGINALLK